MYTYIIDDTCIRIEQPAYLYIETRSPVICTGKNEFGRVEIWVDG